MRRLPLAALMLVLFLSACGYKVSDQSIAQRYLVGRGYRLLAYRGSFTFRLERAYLLKLPGLNVWSVQRQDPGPYLGRVVTAERFILTHHPLDHWELRDRLGHLVAWARGQTMATVFLSGHRVIGGVSYPVYDTPHRGEILYGQPPWSLAGHTFQEVHPEYSSFDAWLRGWRRRFAEPVRVPVVARAVGPGPA